MHQLLSQSLNSCSWKSAMLYANFILKENPKDYQAIFSKVFCYYCSKKYTELEKFYSSLPEELAKEENILDIYCRSLVATKQYKRIIFLLGGEPDIISINPPLILLEDVFKSPVLRKYRDLALFNLSETEKRPDILESKIQPKAIDILHPQNLISTIITAMNTHNADLLEHFTTLSDNTTENDPLILTGCACYCILRGDPLNQVTAILVKATTVDPDCEIAWLTLAYSYILASEYDQSLATLRNVDRRFPNSINFLAFEASLHLKSGSLSLAWPWIKRACDIAPDSPFILQEKGVAYLMEGNLSSASKLFQSVLRMTEEHDILVAAQINLGHCYRKMKKYDEAIEMYQAALSNENNSVNALSSIGFTYHLQKNFDNAILYYNQCLSIDPVNPFATKMLDIAIQFISM